MKNKEGFIVTETNFLEYLDRYCDDETYSHIKQHMKAYIDACDETIVRHKKEFESEHKLLKYYMEQHQEAIFIIEGVKRAVKEHTKAGDMKRELNRIIDNSFFEY